MTTRYSKQREVILKYLVSAEGHPTAESVYEAVRMEIPNISLGTVYRNLAFLTGSGKINTLRTQNEVLRYDASLYDHYHWQCRLCGKVGDLTMRVDPGLNEEAGRLAGIKIESHELRFSGVCAECEEQ